MDISLVKEELAKLSRKSSLQSPSEVRTQAWLLLSVAGLLVLKHCHLLSDMWSRSSSCRCSVHPHTRYNQCCSPSSQVVIPARSTAKLKWTRFSRWTISNYCMEGLDMNQLHNAPSKHWNHRAEKNQCLSYLQSKKKVCVGFSTLDSVKMCFYGIHSVFMRGCIHFPLILSALECFFQLFSKSNNDYNLQKNIWQSQILSVICCEELLKAF